MFRTLLFLFLLITLCFPVEGARRASAKKRKLAQQEEGTGTVLARIYEWEQMRLAGLSALRTLVHHGSAQIYESALLAIARIGDDAALEEITKILNRNDSARKRAAIDALAIMCGEMVPKILSQHIPMQKDPRVITSILEAIGRCGTETHLELFRRFILEEKNPELVTAAMHGLGLLWTNLPENTPIPSGLLTRLAAFAGTGGDPALYAAFALARYKGPVAEIPIVPVLAALKSNKETATRAFLLRAIGRAPSPLVATALSQELAASEASIRVEAAKGIAFQTPSQPLMEQMGGMLLSEPSASVIVTLLESLGAHGPNSVTAVDSIDTLFTSATSPWIKATALKTLAFTQPEKARARLPEALRSTALPVLLSTVSTQALLGTAKDLEQVSLALLDGRPAMVQEAIDALSQLPVDTLPTTAKAHLKTAIDRNDPGILSLAAQWIERVGWKDLNPHLVKAYGSLTRRDYIEPKIAILKALGATGDVGSIPFLKTTLDDPDRLVVQSAVNSLKQLNGGDFTVKIPLNSKPSAPPPPISERYRAAQAKVNIKTTRGVFTLRLFPDTSATAAYFVRLVNQGFYDGKTFHRVVPNFVVQGGDPRGDGYGGPGYTIRDEFSSRSHRRGTVGMATAGKDTGGSQFFVNLSQNLHLDGRYTVFGEIVKGLEVVDKLEVGDSILKASVATADDNRGISKTADKTSAPDK